MARDSLSSQLVAAGLITSGSASGLAAMQLDPVPLAPGLARRFVDSNLARASASQREAALLLASELVTSIVLHARTSLEVGVGTVDDAVVLAVTDHDPEAETSGTPLRGRSKALVSALADDHGTVSEPHCRTIWVLLRKQGRANSAGTLQATSSLN